MVYEQPRARIVYRQTAYNTRVTYRQPQRDRVVVRRTIRNDVVTTGSTSDRWDRLRQRRMMRNWEE